MRRSDLRLPRPPRPALLAALLGVVVGALVVGGPGPARPAAPPPPAPDRPVAAAPTPRVAATPPPIPSDEPDDAPAATPFSVPGTRTATRIRIAELGIDLPVLRQPGGKTSYPACDIAMYLVELGQPGGGRAVYLYAHARRGMFLPLLEASKRKRGAELLGMTVEVFTDDARRFRYRISEVRPHQLTLDDAWYADREQLWLQTSEGPKGTKPKLQVVAEPLDVSDADPADARPSASARACR